MTKKITRKSATKPKRKSRSLALWTCSAIVVRLKMTGTKRNQAKVRASLRREIADLLHAKDGPWFFFGNGKVDIEWLVTSAPNKVL